MAHRWAYGFDNPNEAAVLLLVAGGFLWHLTAAMRHGYRWGLVIVVVTGAAIWPCSSRTAWLLYTVAFAASYLFADHLTARLRLGGVLAVGAVAVVTALAPAMRARLLLAPWTDGSIGARLGIWSAAPRLLADNPSGWGTDRAGPAYMEWYQDLGDTRTYRTLVSAHLTSLAENGWGYRCLYLGAWSGLLWLGGRRGGPPLLKGCWFTIAVYYAAGFANHVYDQPASWVALTVAATAAVMTRWTRGEWPSPRILFAITAAHASVLGAIWLYGFARPGPLRVTRGTVCYGDGPEHVVVAGDASVLGRFPGRAIREYGLSVRRYTLVFATARWVELPDYTAVLIAGEAPPALRAGIRDRRAAIRRLILVNPTDLEQDFVRLGGGTAEVVFGEFYRHQSEDWPARIVRTLPGVDRYVPIWPQLVDRTG